MHHGLLPAWVTEPGCGSQAALCVNTQRCCTDVMIKVWGRGWGGGGGGGGGGVGFVGVQLVGAESSRGHASNADMEILTRKHRKHS